MQRDSKRLPVPDNCVPPWTYVKDTPASELINQKSGLRADSRPLDGNRPIFASVGVVSQARGSAYIEVGRTKVICAVYGPREVKFRDEFSLLGQLSCELKYATFSSRARRQHQQDADEKEASLIVKEALEPAVRLDKFPKARIDVFAMVLEDDGCALSAAISGASLALADGCIEMCDLVVSATLRQYGELCLVDPTACEQYDLQKSSRFLNNAVLTIAYLPTINQVSSVAQQGALDLQTSKKCIERCIKSCQQVYPVLRQCLVTAVKRKAKTEENDSK